MVVLMQHNIYQNEAQLCELLEHIRKQGRFSYHLFTSYLIGQFALNVLLLHTTMLNQFELLPDQYLCNTSFRLTTHSLPSACRHNHPGGIHVLTVSRWRTRLPRHSVDSHSDYTSVRSTSTLEWYGLYTPIWPYFCASYINCSHQTYLEVQINGL